jgi:RNA polymerase sigma factor (sigma-70 family)
MNRVLRQIRRVALRNACDGATDAHLLELFLTQRDEAAFEALLRRHGPMVLGVCRRVLRHAQDAEDAFQATFLVLVRRAASLRSRELLGNWLYGVAHRTALSARAMSAKRRARERHAPERPAPDAPAEAASEELLAQLDAALARLPDRYRVPIVLCELEGRSRKEVARTLGLPEGTLSWRLAHAKKLLARRLARYGTVLTAAGLTAALAHTTAAACVPTSLLNTTARAALRIVAGESLKAEAVSAHVVILTEGVLKAMMLSKLKTMWAVALVVAIGAGAVGLTYRPAVAQPPSPFADRPAEKLAPAAPLAGRAAPDELEELRLEVAALRKGLEVTRERVKALEGQVQSLRAKRPDGGSRDLNQTPSRAPVGIFGRPLNEQGADPALFDRLRTNSDPRKLGLLDPKPQSPSDPFADAEAALKRLRQHPEDTHAAEVLEQMLRRLKERQKPAAPQPKIQ